jgi:hypothetical protein
MFKEYMNPIQNTYKNSPKAQLRFGEFCEDSVTDE